MLLQVQAESQTLLKRDADFNSARTASAMGLKSWKKNTYTPALSENTGVFFWWTIMTSVSHNADGTTLLTWKEDSDLAKAASTMSLKSQKI